MNPLSPQMVNIWDVAPDPEAGDKLEDKLAAAKGHATSEWEVMESELAELFSVFSGLPYRSRDGFFAYSLPTNFHGRLDGTADAARKHFTRYCDQHYEGEFNRIAKVATGLSARRNEIVHSYIHPLGRRRRGALNTYSLNAVTINAWEISIFLVPPRYSDRRYDQNNKPAFLYSSIEVEYYRSCFRWLTHLIYNLLYQLRGFGKPPAL